jgi:GT2 family glycosyltransferase
VRQQSIDTSIGAVDLIDEAAIVSLPSNALRVCVIIPTKNRSHDLQLAVRSLFAQTCNPGSVVVIDQSLDDESRLRVQDELAAAQDHRSLGWNINYVRDPAISGAATARNRAMAIADGDIWLFLDDDVVLEPDFIEQILTVYRDYPDVDGVSGVISNYQRPSAWSRAWNALFVRGPFHDERQPIYWNADRLRNSRPIPVRRFTGCLMSFRADVIRDRRFDENLRGVSDGEDIDFCMQLGSATRLVIAPGARLEHRHSPVGRSRNHWLRRSVRGNFFLYHKNWNQGFFNHLCYWWLWAGYYFVALVASLRRMSFDPWRALRTGAAEASQTTRPQGARAM